MEETQINSWDQLILATLPDDSLTGSDLMAWLHRGFLETDVFHELLKNKIIHREIERQQVEVTDEEVQAAINNFRLQKHLLTGSATQKWLSKVHLNSTDFWTVFEDNARANKLKKLLIDDELVEESFALNKSTLSRVSYYQIVVKQEKKAAELSALIKMGSCFFELARKYSEDGFAKSCGYGGVRLITDFDPELQYRISAASDGDLIGPIKCLGQYHLVLIDRVIKPQLDDETREGIRTQLFEAWCNAQVSSTPITVIDEKEQDGGKNNEH